LVSFAPFPPLPLLIPLPLGLLLLGHGYMVLLVMLCQTLVYREITTLFSLKKAGPESRDVESLKGKDPWSKTLNWYFFAVTNYFLYGESIIYYFKVRPKHANVVLFTNFLYSTLSLQTPTSCPSPQITVLSASRCTLLDLWASSCP